VTAWNISAAGIRRRSFKPSAPYANDFSNTNGGYVVIGIEEKYGRPLLPPVGIDKDSLDEVQKELFEKFNTVPFDDRINR